MSQLLRVRAVLQLAALSVLTDLVASASFTFGTILPGSAVNLTSDKTLITAGCVERFPDNNGTLQAWGALVRTPPSTGDISVGAIALPLRQNVASGAFNMSQFSISVLQVDAGSGLPGQKVRCLACSKLKRSRGQRRGASRG